MAARSAAALATTPPPARRRHNERPRPAHLLGRPSASGGVARRSPLRRRLALFAAVVVVVAGHLAFRLPAGPPRLLRAVGDEGLFPCGVPAGGSSRGRGTVLLRRLPRPCRGGVGVREVLLRLRCAAAAGSHEKKVEARRVAESREEGPGVSPQQFAGSRPGGMAGWLQIHVNKSVGTVSQIAAGNGLRK